MGMGFPHLVQNRFPGFTDAPHRSQVLVITGVGTKGRIPALTSRPQFMQYAFDISFSSPQKLHMFFTCGLGNVFAAVRAGGLSKMVLLPRDMRIGVDG